MKIFGIYAYIGLQLFLQDVMSTDWLVINGKDFWISDKQLNWTSARDDCVDRGGHLARFKDGETARSVAYYVASYRGFLNVWWIDLNDRDTEGVFVTSDGLEPAWTSWHIGEPDDLHTDLEGNADCVIFKYRDGMFDRRCSANYYYVCQKDDMLTDWQTINGEDFWISDKQLNWALARDDCVDKGGHLARFKDDYTALAVAQSAAQILGSWNVWWIDLNDRDTEGVFVTSDGLEAPWTCWRFNEPNDLHTDLEGLADCVIFKHCDGMYDRRCSAYYYFVCQKEKRTTAQDEPTTVVTYAPTTQEEDHSTQEAQEGNAGTSGTQVPSSPSSTPNLQYVCQDYQCWPSTQP